MKLYASVCSVVCVALLTASPSAAQKRVEREGGRWSWFLPELKVAAKTSGKATFSVRGSFAWGIHQDGDLLLWPIGSVQTEDGVAKLISIDADDDTEPDTAVPWRLGGAIGYMHFADKRVTDPTIIRELRKKAERLCRTSCESPTKGYCKTIKAAVGDFLWQDYKAIPIDAYCAESVVKYKSGKKKQEKDALAIAIQTCNPPTDSNVDVLCPDGKKAYDAHLDNFRKKLFNSCLAQCSGVEETGFCKEARAAELHTLISAEDLCEAGQKAMSLSRDDDALLPAHVIALGAVAGRDSFQYLSPGATDATLLVEERERRTAVKAALVGTHVFSRWATLEWGAIYERRTKAATDTVRFCTPQGNVVRGDAAYDPMNDGTFDVAQSCKTRVLGAPTMSHDIALFTEYGITGSRGEGWRVALRPNLVLSLPDEGSVQVDRFTLGLPIYLDLYSLPKEYGAYRGILRLTPALESLRGDSGELEQRAVLTFELLAQRTMFASVADRL